MKNGRLETIHEKQVYISKEQRDFVSKVTKEDMNSIEQRLKASRNVLNIVFEDNTAYHAETLNEAKMLLREAIKQGYEKWEDTLNIYNCFWDNYVDESCYLIQDYAYSYINHLESFYTYKIVKVKDLFKLN